jgi:phosphoribosylanthranilate isomerase
MSMVEIKICGITRVEDALAAAEFGAAMLGLNFYAGSPRCITLERAQKIAKAVGGRARLVGVFVDMNVMEVLRIARSVPLDSVQLHGGESVEDCEAVAAEFEVIRALKVDSEFSAECAAQFAGCRGLLLDAPSVGHGGSGSSFEWNRVDWKSVRRVSPRAKVFLAGGLNAANVQEAIAMVHPDAVDVCSGVESEKGIKSMQRMREFMAAVWAVERQEQ